MLNWVKKKLVSAYFRIKKSWRLPTLPLSFPSSTIGVSRLNFRVRNGTGCTPAALTTSKIIITFYIFFKKFIENNQVKTFDLLVLLDLTHYCAYIYSLSTSQSRRCLIHIHGGYLILSMASRLDAFSGYLNRTQLLSYASGDTTDTPEVRPSRSSRTKDRFSQIYCAPGRQGPNCLTPF